MITSAEVERYVEGVLPEPDDLLAEMQAHGARDGIPIVVPVTGALLGVLTAATGARRVVEVGTAIGVSTLHIARALPEGGVIVSFEIDPERHRAAVAYLERGGMAARADLRLQDAAAGLAELEGPFDMAFIDGLKQDYPGHLELVIRLLRPGGLLVVDNTLLSGTVASGRSDGQWSDAHIARMQAFNRDTVSRPELEGIVVPVGDGLLVAVRRG